MGRQLEDYHPAPGEPRPGPTPVGSQLWQLGWEPWPVLCPFSRNRRTGSQIFLVRVSSFGCVGLGESLRRRGHHMPRAGVGAGGRGAGGLPTAGPSLAPPGRLPRLPGVCRLSQTWVCCVPLSPC